MLVSRIFTHLRESKTVHFTRKHRLSLSKLPLTASFVLHREVNSFQQPATLLLLKPTKFWTHSLHAIFNRNTLKLSYSCMPNVKSIISTHNKNLIKPNTEDPNKNLCNCRKKAECPLDNQCLAKGIVYQATVTSYKHT